MKDKRGLLTLRIDEVVSCLKNNETGEIVETVVFRVETRSFLNSFNKKNGWYEDWSTFSEKVEIYALATKRDMEIQGLIALEKDVEARAVFINWACTAPHNNHLNLEQNGEKPRYNGVGGHLFAIAADKSVDWGYDGCIHGYAANKQVLHHYESVLGATYLGIMHQYHFAVLENEAKNLLEVYDYEWNNIEEANTEIC